MLLPSCSWPRDAGLFRKGNPEGPGGTDEMRSDQRAEEHGCGGGKGKGKTFCDM